MREKITEKKNDNCYDVVIDGNKCKNIHSFLEEIGAAFKFPDYYGVNLNAFWDCIGDLSWLKANNYCLTIENSKAFLSEETRKAQKEILDLLERVKQDWSNVPNFEGEDEYRKRSDFQIFYK